MSQQVVKFIRKSNNLVEAKYKFDIWEMRLFTKMLTLIQRDDEDFKDYKIYLRDIVQDFQLTKNKEAYGFLREGAKGLMDKKFYIPYEEDGVRRLFETPIISGLDSAITDGRKSVASDHLYLTISFHPKMKPFLLQLKSQFTMYDVRNILKLPSTYSIRIYELLKQYEKIGWRLFYLQELKSILGIDDKYKLYGHFKKRVLLKAQKDIKSFTDIQFTFEELKKGRGVDRIKFFIKKNAGTTFQDQPSLEMEPGPSQETSAPPILNELHTLVKEHMTKTALLNLLHQYPEDQVSNAIRYTLNRIKKGDTIKNVGGYIVKMAKQETIFDTDQVERASKRAKKKVEKERQQQKATLEEELKALHKQIHREEMTMIEILIEEHPTAKATAMESVRLHHLTSDSYNPNLSDEENLQKPNIQGAYVHAFKKAFPQPFKLIDKKYSNQIKILKRQIVSL